jgi:hypothetical protein
MYGDRRPPLNDSATLLIAKGLIQFSNGECPCVGFGTWSSRRLKKKKEKGGRKGEKKGLYHDST